MTRIDPRATVVVTWSDLWGSTFTWPMGTVDNRRSRVIARLRAWGMDDGSIDWDTLKITRVN
jgi:hypothetical protein